MEFALGLALLAMYVLLGLRTFDRETESARIYTLGRTGKSEIRGPTTEVVHSNRAIQFVAGSRVVVWTFFGLQRLVRVSGEAKGAWIDRRGRAVGTADPQAATGYRQPLVGHGVGMGSRFDLALSARPRGTVSPNQLRFEIWRIREAMRDE